MPDGPKINLGSWAHAPEDWINIDGSWNAWLSQRPRLRRAAEKVGVLPDWASRHRVAGEHPGPRSAQAAAVPGRIRGRDLRLARARASVPRRGRGSARRVPARAARRRRAAAGRAGSPRGGGRVRVRRGRGLAERTAWAARPAAPVGQSRLSHVLGPEGLPLAQVDVRRGVALVAAGGGRVRGRARRWAIWRAASTGSRPSSSATA